MSVIEDPLAEFRCQAWTLDSKGIIATCWLEEGHADDHLAARLESSGRAIRITWSNAEARADG